MTKETVKTLKNEARYRPTIWGDARPLLLEAAKEIEELTAMLAEAEDTIGSNLVWITDKVDLAVRQKDTDTLARLEQLEATWKRIVATLKAHRD
jgi:hypothetical protein